MFIFILYVSQIFNTLSWVLVQHQVHKLHTANQMLDEVEEEISCGGAIASCPSGPALEEGSAEWSELAKSHWESYLQKSA